MSETPEAHYVVERRDGAWLVLNPDGSTFSNFGGTQRGYQRALNSARFHNMELRHHAAVERRREERKPS